MIQQNIINCDMAHTGKIPPYFFLIIQIGKGISRKSFFKPLTGYKN